MSRTGEELADWLWHQPYSNGQKRARRTDVNGLSLRRSKVFAATPWFTRAVQRSERDILIRAVLVGQDGLGQLVSANVISPTIGAVLRGARVTTVARLDHNEEAGRGNNAPTNVNKLRICTSALEVPRLDGHVL
jgi:hypothetical protein